MITKLLAPQKNGEINYDNKGSSERLITYFEHEAKDQDETGKYFSLDEDGIDKDEVISRIDNNVKGLKRDDTKFISLVIAPSGDELNHILNDKEKLKNYTKQVMENYAKNFALKDNKRFSSSDLVWFGIVHTQRKYHWNDKDVKEQKAQRGEKKGGPQMHVHIIVSTRDAAQQTTLNPKTSRARFNLVNFQQTNAETFQKEFAYTKQNHYYKEKPKKNRTHIDKARYVEQRIGRLADKYALSEEVVNRISGHAVDTDYSKQFYGALNAYSKRIHNKQGSKEDLHEFEGLNRNNYKLKKATYQLGPISTYQVSKALKGAEIEEDQKISRNDQLSL